MSQRFSPKIEEMRQGNPTATEDDSDDYPKQGDIYYPTHGNVRDICFVLLDGRMVSLNYSYLIAKDINVERTEMVLTFSSHTVTAKGINLESVFFKIMSQYVRLLKCTDARYNPISPDRPVVNSIEVVANASG